MFKYRWVFIIVPFLMFLEGCRENFDYRDASGELLFSKDTVYLDTVFNSLSSSTYSFKVYNTSNDDIRIPSVYLKAGADSGFRLNVNGNSGQAFSDVEISANDSIFVFVESTFDLDTLSSPSFLATDAVVFGNIDTQQEVALVTLVRDAIFLFPQRENGITESLPIGVDENGEPVSIEGFVLQDDQLTFTNNRPYVIYGYAAVPAGKVLEIQEGSRVYFHEASGILVQQGASLHVLGSKSNDTEVMEKEVIFEGDRLEPEFSDIPGQWGTIWLAAGSTNNRLEHLTVKNAVIGLFAEGDPQLTPPKTTIVNSRFLNSANINILARNTSFYARNTIAGSAGQVSVFLAEGGNYELLHCTIANFWNQGPRSLPALLISNYTETSFGERSTSPLTKAQFTNNIISGNAGIEMLFDRDEQEAFNILFRNSILQFDTNNSDLLQNPLYDFTDGNIYEEILLNSDPEFVRDAPDPFQLSSSSPAINIGTADFISEAREDILGNLRDQTPDAGAYEFQGN
ncbi:hypothetical protein E7Z59_10040 [Robertkochia marina]|uniref:Right-handed parallel beta-helix repeat-containing protein n=1 Tax=Robertkochia marina TaxID=1227945 RepID=A0A4S3M1T1_9FLAO|nr:hypothetical protein [Robertkochia marina]THD67977.1 hypothetical protein E7Z59_10040 [Robertkochia marina]TRZ41526.1 hypothetical protein D3A96_13070 [Robertkochia marina]